jgi:hypothetical protein
MYMGVYVGPTMWRRNLVTLETFSAVSEIFLLAKEDGVKRYVPVKLRKSGVLPLRLRHPFMAPSSFISNVTNCSTKY